MKKRYSIWYVPILVTGCLFGSILWAETKTDAVPDVMIDRFNVFAANRGYEVRYASPAAKKQLAELECDAACRWESVLGQLNYAMVSNIEGTDLLVIFSADSALPPKDQLSEIVTARDPKGLSGILLHTDFPIEGETVVEEIQFTDPSLYSANEILMSGPDGLEEWVILTEEGDNNPSQSGAEEADDIRMTDADGIEEWVRSRNRSSMSGQDSELKNRAMIMTDADGIEEHIEHTPVSISIIPMRYSSNEADSSAADSSTLPSEFNDKNLLGCGSRGKQGC